MVKKFESLEDIKFINVKNKKDSSIGSGAFGTVHLVSHIKDTSKLYAMKVIKKFPA